MATEEKLKIVISADNADAVASLNELSQQLKKFEKGVKDATNGSDLLAFNKGLTETRAKMEVLNASLNPITAQTKNLATGSNQAAFALQNVGRVAQDLPFGFMGIQNNLNPLLESFQRLKAETGSNMSALKALGSSLIGAGGVGLALSVASSAFLMFGDKLFDSGKKAKEAQKAIDDATQSVVKDAAQIQVLAAQYQRTNLSLEDRKSIIKQLNEISPEYFNKLKAESSNYGELKIALDAYTASLSNQIKAKVRGIELEKVLTEQLKKQDEQKKIIAIQEDFALKNKTGQQAVGSKQLAKEIELLDKKAKYLELEISGLTKVKALEDKGGGGTVTNEKVSDPSEFKGKFRLEQIVGANQHLLAVQKEMTDQIQNQYEIEVKKEALIRLGIPVKTKYDGRENQSINESRSELANKRLYEQLLAINAIKSAQAEWNTQMQKQIGLAESVGNTLSHAFQSMVNAKNPFEALTNAVKQLVVDLAAAVAKMLIIRAIMSILNPGAAIGKTVGSIIAGTAIGMHAKGGVTTGPSLGVIGEAGPEAILPLDRFRGFVDQAARMGAMTMAGSGGQGGNGQFILRGNDLVLAMQRSNYSLNLRRG